MKDIDEFRKHEIFEKKPRVALVFPNYGYEENIEKNKNASILPPFGLLSIEENIKDLCEVKIFDANIYPDSTSFFSELDMFLKDGGILGVSTFTRTYKQTMQEILDRYPDDSILKIIGGPFATNMPDLTHAHIVIRGEGELPLRQLLLQKLKDIDSIKGIYYQKNQRLVNTGKYFLKSLNQIIPIDYDQSKLLNYRSSSVNQIELNENVFFYMSSRSCSKNCTFCNVREINGNIKFLALETVLKDLEKGIRQGYKTIQFWDDNLLDRPEKELKRILSLLSQNNIKYTCLARADQITEEKAKFLASTGCARIFFGIESGNSEILEFYNKRETIEQITKGIALANSAGILTVGGMIIGAPMETTDTIKQSIEFSQQLGLYKVMFGTLAADPGTGIFDYALKNGLIKLDHNGLFIPDEKIYGITEPRGLPVLSRITIPQEANMTQLLAEKEYLSEMNTKAHAAFYLRKEYVEKFYHKNTDLSVRKFVLETCRRYADNPSDLTKLGLN